MSDSKVNWVYPYSEVRSNRKGRRTSLLGNPQEAYELIGYEGNLSGGLKPSNGFLQVADLDNLSDEFDASSHTIDAGDFHSFSVRAGDDLDISGWVFRINQGSGTYKIIVVYKGCTGWSEEVLIADAGSSRWSVFVLGRFVYVYIRGKTPKRFYFQLVDPDGSGSASASCGDATFTSQDITNQPPIALDQDTYEDYTELDVAVFEAGVSSPTTSKIFFGEFYFFKGFSANLYDNDTGIPTTGAEFSAWTYPGGRAFIGWQYRFTGTGTDSGVTLTGGQSYHSPESPNSGTGDGVNLASKQVQEAQTSWEAFEGSGNPFDSEVWASAWDVPVVAPNLQCAISYVLYNSKTGEESPPAETVTVTTNFSTREDGTPRESSSTEAPAFEGVVDSSLYDSIRIYRSVWGTSNSLVSGNLFLALDATISDLTSPDQGTLDSGWTRISGILTLGDSGIQATRNTIDLVTLGAVPKGGVADSYANTAFVSDVSRGQANTNEIQYSRTTTLAGEQFPALNVFDLNLPSDPIISWQVAADNLIGWTKTQQYLLRKEGPFVKMVGMHRGFGVVGQRATTTYGGLAYAVTKHGVVVTSSRGELDRVRELDQIISEDWKDTQDNIMLEFDPSLSVIFMQNPDANHMVLLWMREGRFTELLDTRFTGLATGVVPGSESRGTRTMFCTTSGLVHIYDSDREKTDGSGNTRTSLMDISGDIVLLYSGDASPQPVGDYEMVVTDTDGNSPTLDESAAGEVYVYIGSGTDYAEKHLVKSIDNTAKTITVDTSGWGDNLEAGDIITLSPIYCRVVNSALGNLASDGTPFASPSAHMVKQLTHMGVVFTDVEGPKATTGVAKYRALAYDSNNGTPKKTALVLDPADGTEYRSIQENEAQFWARLPVDAVFLFPGWETLAADYTFNALSAQIEGKIRSAKQAGAR